jgi:hypothetical protein
MLHRLLDVVPDDLDHPDHPDVVCHLDFGMEMMLVRHDLELFLVRADLCDFDLVVVVALQIQDELILDEVLLMDLYLHVAPVVVV